MWAYALVCTLVMMCVCLRGYIEQWLVPAGLHLRESQPQSHHYIYTQTHTFSCVSLSQYKSWDGEQEIEVGKEIGEKMGECGWGGKEGEKGFRSQHTVGKVKKTKEEKRGKEKTEIHTERLEEGHWRMNISHER